MLLILIIMTLPNLNDFNDMEGVEFTRYDGIMIILNFIGYFVFGWEKMIYIFTISIFVMGLIVFVLLGFRMCCWPDSRQAVFAPFGREHYD